ncbi:Outer membrane protein [Helicobacter bizzozeronii]|uniref:outer membrane protein n=2 Tax=Helicobacter bizzozeronii TaxID=56877 RepID=UPI000CEF1E17|nr:outer membrane protein [Helicobacter bizzozeronii]GMB93482.1 Outer membrane protein [Helicobacter bizzozeronii]
MVKRVFLGMGFAGLLGVPLEAAKDGWFAQVGVQYSHAAGSRAYKTPNATTTYPFSGDLGGVDFQGGYKQFFGKKRHWGVRYYGLISLQGGGFSEKTDNKYPTQGSLGNYFYGVGIDALWNFFRAKGYDIGAFVGMAVGGSTWTLGAGKANGVCQTTVNNAYCVSYNDWFLKSAIGNNNATFSATFVQWMFNFGVRANFGVHNGVEVGFRVPAINNPYYSAYSTGQTNTFSFRRVIILYANYVYNF